MRRAGFSLRSTGCSTRRLQYRQHTGLAAPQHVGSSQTRLEPVFPALARGFLSTGSPGKPLPCDSVSPHPLSFQNSPSLLLNSVWMDFRVLPNFSTKTLKIPRLSFYDRSSDSFLHSKTHSFRGERTMFRIYILSIFY